MISSLECIDFKEEYTDEFDSSRKVRNKSCQHFEINMKLYSNQGKFKKYSITFTCKFCQNDIVNEFYENNKRFKYECIKCNNSICFSYINTLEDTVNPELIKKPDKKDNYKKFDFNEINKHDEELIFNQVNAKFPLNKGNNEAKVNIYKTPSSQPEPKIYKTPNIPQTNIIKENNEAKVIIYKTPSFKPQPKNYKTPNNPDPMPKKNQHPKNPPDKYSSPMYEICQTPNQNVNDGGPAPVCENIQNKINNNSDVIKKVNIKFVFNDSNNHIELNPSISMEQQYDKIQKKFEFNDKKKIYLNGEEIDYKTPLSEIKCLDKCILEIGEELID